MNILLTANYKNGLFSNGLQQNIVFLAELLKGIGFTPIIAINHKIEECIDPPTDILIIEENELLEYCEDISFILNTAWMINADKVNFIKKSNPECKNVHVLYGNSMLADIERCSWEDHISVNPDSVDGVWISPHYEISFEYFKTYYKTEKVFELPYIWSPKYVKIHEKIWNSINKSCFYNEKDKKHIAILEPNLNITKHCLPSIMALEEFFNQNGKELKKDINVYCSAKLIDKLYFKTLINKLNIFKHKKIFFAKRKKVAEIFSHECDLVVSHQLLNGLNYTYLEALYFNIPLVHNSEYIKEAGYFYPNYDTNLAAKAIKNAITNHSKNLQQYKEKSAQVLNKYSPTNPIVIEKYKKLLS